MNGKLDRRLAALADAVALARGRLEDDRVEHAHQVAQRAGRRLGLGVEATVIALAGPTGAGKSSLFNALAGADLAAVSVRRPTTAAAAAAVWGDVGGELLDWLEIPTRHRVEDGGVGDLALLDLPDFDSVERGHRLEVDRLIDLVDLVVWVVDPQKYADAALHEHYLRPLAAYGDTMMVALNHADLLDEEARSTCRADLKRLLRDDGLASVPVLAVSARTGDGIQELWRILRKRVAVRGAAVARLSVDVSTVASALGAACGGRSPGAVRRADRERLTGALAEAAGLPVIVTAVGNAHRRRGALATGWPFARWVRRLRPDPLRRLRLSDRPEPAAHSSLPAPSPVQRAGVVGAARALATVAAGELPHPWPGLVRSAATAREDELADRLDLARAGADMHMSRPRWWRAVGALQSLLAAAVVLGALWLAVLAVLGYLELDDVLPIPDVAGLALPTLMLGGGILAGLLLALAMRMVHGAAARRRARAAGRSVRKRVGEVGLELIVRPVEAELLAHDRLCAALDAARG